MNPLDSLRHFFKLESAAGILLVIAAGVAIVAANSPLAHVYAELLDLRLAVKIGNVGLDKPLLLWVNDGLMAVFFFLVGLELKREALEGQLSDRSQILLPLVCAVGGFILPAVLYALLNRGDATALAGWAIPAATDIAFSLGVLALLGERVPLSLKVFLTSLAIFDDVAAIVVIGIFYSKGLSWLSLALAALGCVALVVLNRTRVAAKGAYVLVGVFIWVCVLKSGVHATLAGIAVALAIPMTRSDGGSPLREMEHALHPYVSYLILPLFAFANAGLSFAGLDVGSLFSGVPLGIAVGLFVGKQVGVFGVAWVLIKLRVAALPQGSTWLGLYGVAVLTGIGFTMSLFIGTLAFDHNGVNYAAPTRLGVLSGSLASALLGYAVLRGAYRRR